MDRNEIDYESVDEVPQQDTGGNQGKPAPANGGDSNETLKNETKMKKLINFAIICLWVLGGIGGVGYAIYEGSWPIAAGCAVNALLALPTVKKHFDELSD